MIYMVEMALLDTARRVEWDAWYVAHQHRLLSIPGIRASQRFESVRPVPSPFVAIHEVDSAEVFTSATYRAKAGPGNTGEWQTKMGNWHRNLFDGVAHSPDVPLDARLVLIEENVTDAVVRGMGVQGAMSGPPAFSYLTAVGLDRTVTRRGLAVMPPAADAFADTPGVRVLRPLGPRLVAPAL